MNENATKVAAQNPNKDGENNKVSFLKSSSAARNMLDRCGIKGFQLGGGAIDFALNQYRRPHGDVDVVYIVASTSWGDYQKKPNFVPQERIRLQNIVQETEFVGVSIEKIPGIDRVGVPGFRTQGGVMTTHVDFIESYIHTENGNNYIMMPRYDGGSYIKIPENEIVESEIEGIKVHTPSLEMLFLMRKQEMSILRTLKGGPPPYRSEKAKKDMNALEQVIDLKKIRELERIGLGYNFQINSSIQYFTKKLIEHFFKN